METASGAGASDYRVNSGSLGISQSLPFRGANLILWDVPADPSHDTEREAPNTAGDLRHPDPQPRPQGPVPLQPDLLRGTPGVFTARGDSWEQPGVFDTRFLGKDPNGNAFTFTGCEQVPFDPEMSAQLTSRSTDSPTGISVDFVVPQNESPRGHRYFPGALDRAHLPEGDGDLALGRDRPRLPAARLRSASAPTPRRPARNPRSWAG